MAAIAYPRPGERPQVPARRHLTVVPAPARRRARSAVYWRRRLLVLVAAVLIVIAARAALGALGGGPLAAPEAPAGRGGATAVYVVQAGDTYWSIARHLQPNGDVRALVDRLSSGHHGAPLQPGEQLVLR
jgi:nucleoid-associated protein YgaU